MLEKQWFVGVSYWKLEFTGVFLPRQTSITPCSILHEEKNRVLAFTAASSLGGRVDVYRCEVICPRAGGFVHSNRRFFTLQRKKMTTHLIFRLLVLLRLSAVYITSSPPPSDLAWTWE